MWYVTSHDMLFMNTPYVSCLVIHLIAHTGHVLVHTSNNVSHSRKNSNDIGGITRHLAGVCTRMDIAPGFFWQWALLHATGVEVETPKAKHPKRSESFPWLF